MLLCVCKSEFMHIKLLCADYAKLAAVKHRRSGGSAKLKFICMPYVWLKTNCLIIIAWEANIVYFKYVHWSSDKLATLCTPRVIVVCSFIQMNKKFLCSNTHPSMIEWYAQISLKMLLHNMCIFFYTKTLSETLSVAQHNECIAILR